jgi:protein O-GlcNAc transferase
MSTIQSPDEMLADAVLLHTRGDFASAEAGYRQLLSSLPTHAGALCNLGTILVRTERLQEAEQCYAIALAAHPDFPDTYYNAGNLARRQGDFDTAAQHFRTCVKLQPRHISAWFNLGVVGVNSGKLKDAAEAFRQVTQLEPTATEADLRLGDVLLRSGDADGAVTAFERYVKQFPNEPRGLYNYALALANQNKPAEAQALLQQVLKIKPDYAEAHNALALSLELMGRKDDANHHYERAVQLKPDLAEAWSNLGINLSEQGRSEEAIAALRNSVLQQKNAVAIHSNLCLLLNYSSRLTPEQIRTEHDQWGQLYASPVENRPAPHLPHDPTRKLRIGYVSADFRTHTVSGMIELLLRHHDRTQYEVFAYPACARFDDRSNELKTLADHWKPITGMSDRDSAAMIEADRIDILIDLAGHTAGNRLITFAFRPAAVQATLFGYPNTTGMGAMDFRITDEVSDPPGATEHLYVEALLRLPQVPWVYLPPTDAPDVTPLPASQRRQFTFGCLNNSAKISDACLDAWAKLIQATPGSRIVVMAGQSQAGTKRLADRFVKAGILRERVQMLNRLQRGKYFEAYSEFDIALDPFPYNGGVTTCDALYMGIPVMGVAGNSYVSRQGVMLMNMLGLGDFHVSSSADLPALGKHWMTRRAELAEIRAGLRQRLVASPICDVVGYVRNLEAALRGEWTKLLDRNQEI